MNFLQGKRPYLKTTKNQIKMKQKHTNARKANTRFDKSGGKEIYRMSVAARRRIGIIAFDREEYDEKHGMMLQGPGKRTKRLLGFFHRRQAQTA